jgi:CelD/BcsL family acetyltransferase involved in cellulose biosynthesis
MTLATPDVHRVASGVEAIEQPSLAGHAAAWDAAAAASELPSPFLLSWWLEPHAAEADGATFVLVLDEDGQLLGGLAARVDRTLGVRRIRLLGAGSLAPDHLDLVAAPGRDGAVVAAIARWFVREPSFLDLRGVAQAARVVDALPAHRLVTVLSTAPYLALDPSDDQPVKPLHRGSALRRQARKYEREGARFEVAGRDPVELERALGHLHALHAERWGDRSGLTRSFPLFAGATRAAGAAGDARIYLLRMDDAVVAAEIIFDVARRRHRYQAGRSTAPEWAGAGNVLIQHVIQEAQADGCLEVDFLRGAEPYKYDWTTSERDVVWVRAAYGGRARVALLGASLAERARPTARSIKAWMRAQRARRPATPA